MRSVWKMGLAVLGLVAPAAFAQQSVIWEDGNTILAGNGCQKDFDAFVATNGNDLSVVFTVLGIDLPGNASPTLAGRKNCAVRAPARIAPGYYIGKLTQRISYGAIKTPRTQGAVAINSSFFGFNVSPYTMRLPYGTAINNPLMVQQREDLFSVRTQPSWFNGWCSPSRAPRGLYQANIAVTGNKDSARDDLILFVDGLDLKYEVVAGLIKCQI